MKRFLVRLGLAATLTLGAIALTSSASAQDPNTQDPAKTTPQRPSPSNTPDQQSPSAMPQKPTAPPQQEPTEPPAASSHQNEPGMPTSGTEDQTQDARSFSGQITRENGKTVLKDPVTKNIYQIDDESKVKPYMGKQVKVTGRLDVNSNTIHIQTVAPMS